MTKTSPQTTGSRLDEFTAKCSRLRAYMDQHHLTAVVLINRSNSAWLGCGPADGAPMDHVQGSRTGVWHQTDGGVATFVVTRDTVALVTENIELPRLERDEFGGLPIEFVSQPWQESGLLGAINQLVPKGRIAVDALTHLMFGDLVEAGFEPVDGFAGITGLRAELLPREIDRYRWLGKMSATVMSEVCRAINAGMSEADVAADADQRLRRLGITQEVAIVCSDERLQIDRHGLYGDYRIGRQVMVVFCAHKWGLVANLTRMVVLADFVPSELAEQHEALCDLDGTMMRATVPGVALRAIFQETLVPGYERLGAPDAWQDHHQGGSTGYAGRDTRVTPTSPGIVHPHQAFAWNPSLPGIKSEDTFIASETGADVLTIEPSWPVYPGNGRPAILALGSHTHG